MSKLITLIFFYFCLIFSNTANSQVHSSSAYDYLINPLSQQKHILYLTSDSLQGRSTGSRGAILAAKYISNSFSRYGIRPLNATFLQPFTANGKAANNVIGIITSNTGSQEYIIIGSHYDHLGAIGEKVFRGADDNASGISALLNLANAFAKMKEEGNIINKNLIFIAFDAKELSMSGSKFFCDKLKIPSENINCIINIDQIGSVLAPPHSMKEYILVIGQEKLKTWESEQLNFCNNSNHLGLDIDYTFYNSTQFRELFYKLSDHYPFAEKNIPAILFTAGINNNTYKESDTEDIINYPVLTKRTKLIYHFIYQLISA